MLLRPGTLLHNGAYRIIRPLGQGGFGITYLAEEVNSGRRVAIKEFYFKEFCERVEETGVVSVPSVSKRDFVERFRNKFLKEAMLLMQLRHENIVKVLAVFSENETSYYVMDFVDGGTLSDELQREGTLPPERTLKIADDIMDALLYLHKHKINHLDIKPANIMIDRQSGRALLIDFGVSKQYDKLTGEGTTTTPLGISEGYSPLEQYNQGGIKHFAPTADVYSLGATIYKMLTGETPPSAIEVSQKGDTALLPVEPASMGAAVKAAMSARASDRPASIGIFADMLHGRCPLTAMDDSGRTKLHSEHNQKNWMLPLLIGGGVIFAIALGVVVFFLFLTGSTKTIVPTPPFDSTLVDSTQTQAEAELQQAQAEQQARLAFSTDSTIVENFTRKYLLARISDESNDRISPSGLEKNLFKLLRDYEMDPTEFYGSPKDPLKDGAIRHIGNDVYKPSLKIDKIVEEECPEGKLYHLSFALYYDGEYAGLKEIKTLKNGDTVEIYDICTDTSQYPNHVWVREALANYYNWQL